jgi:hypothetical protein
MRWMQTRAAHPGAVVLSAPWLATRLAIPRWKLAAAQVLLRVAPGLPIASGSHRPDFLTRDPDRAAEYRADPLVHHVVSARFHAGVTDAQARVQEADWPDVPTLLMLPGDDRSSTPEASRELCGPEHGTLRVVDPSYGRGGGTELPQRRGPRARARSPFAEWLDRVRDAAEPSPGGSGIGPRRGVRGGGWGGDPDPLDDGPRPHDRRTENEFERRGARPRARDRRTSERPGTGLPEAELEPRGPRPDLAAQPRPTSSRVSRPRRSGISA